MNFSFFCLNGVQARKMTVTSAGLRKGADRLDPAPRLILAGYPAYLVEAGCVGNSHVEPAMRDKRVLIRVGITFPQDLDPDIIPHADHQVRKVSDIQIALIVARTRINLNARSGEQRHVCNSRGHF